MALNDYRFALEFQETLKRLVSEELERQRPRYQMATVVSIDRVTRNCVVTYPGDTSSGTVSMGSIQPSAPGQVVRIEGLSGDRYIADVMGPSYTDESYYALRSQSLLSGGGTISVSATYEVGWSQRFILISIGRGTDLTRSGFFDIAQPAAGTVITGYGGAPNRTVTAAGVPLNIWEALWYELPFRSTSSSIPGNFRVSHYTSDFVVPNNWILVCLRNSDTGLIHFATGDKVAASQSATKFIGWTNVASEVTVRTDAASSAATGTAVTLARAMRDNNLVTFYGNASIGTTAVTNGSIMLPPSFGVAVQRQLAFGTLYNQGGSTSANQFARMVAAKDRILTVSSTGAFLDFTASTGVYWFVQYEVS